MYPNRNHLPPARLLSRCLALLLLAAFVFAGVGCDSGPKDIVSGFVTLNGKPVAGTIQFVGASKESQAVPIGPKGDYTLPNPPHGECDVIIKGMGGVGGVTGPVKDASGASKDTMKDAGGLGGTGGMAVAPPKKYEQKGTLKFTVEGGKQKKDFELTSP